MTADAPLDPQDLARLRTLTAGRSKAQLGELVAGVGAKAMTSALAGLPVRAATRELIRQHLGADPVACICKPGWGHRSGLKREPSDSERVFDCPATGPGGVP